MLRKREAFSIARLPPIPTMSTRSLDRRVRTWLRASVLFSTDPIAAFAAAEAKLTKALSSVPDHARAHMFLGFVEMMTKRAAEGIAKCEHALALDRNLASAHSFIGRGKMLVGRAEETEAHVAEALRLSPRDTMANTWMMQRGLCEKPARRLGPSGGVVPAGDRGQSKSSDSMVSVGRRARAAWSTGRGAFRGQGWPRARPVLHRLPRPRRLDDAERRPNVPSPA